MKKLKITRCHVLLVLIAVSLIGGLAVPALAADPLPSWREGPNKQLIIAVGNSEGDRDMLEYSDDKNPATPDLQMIINHDDSEREYEYAVEAVNHLAAENRWHVISMKNDWEQVFDFDKK